MALAVLYSRALAGMDAPPVTVEVHLANGLPSFTIVGLPEAEVKEAKDRVRAALQNARFEFPGAPHHRQPRARGPAQGIGALRPADRARHTRRVGTAARRAARRLRVRGRARADGRAAAGPRRARDVARRRRASSAPSCCRRRNAPEAALVEEARILPAGSLLQVCAHLTGHAPLVRCAASRQSERQRLPRHAGRERAGARQARARNRRGRRAQPAHGRARPAPARRCSPRACPGSCRR